MSKSYEVSIWLTVNDEQALFDTALAHMIDECRYSDAEARTLLASDDEIDVSTCLRMLIDPGSLDGCDIMDSGAECTHCGPPDAEPEEHGQQCATRLQPFCECDCGVADRNKT